MRNVNSKKMGGYCHHMCMLVCLLALLIDQTPVLAVTTKDTTSTTKEPTGPPEIITTTDAPTTTTSTPTTTTTVPTIATTQAPVLNGSCADKDAGWCGDSINGSMCQDDVCVCQPEYFRINDTYCLLITETMLTPELVIGDITVTSLTVNWTTPSSLPDNIPLNHSIKARSVDDQVTIECIKLNNETSASCENLTAGHLFNITVGITFNPVSGNNNIQQSTTPAIPGPLNHTGLDYSAPNITLRWGASVGGKDHYYVYVYDPSSLLKYEGEAPGEEANVTGLIAGTNYTVVISAYSYGEYSDNMTDYFRTNTEVPSEPLGLNIVGQPTFNSIHLGWLAPQQPNGDIVAYEVCYMYRVYDDLAFMGSTCTNVSGISYDAENLPSAGAEYKFEVWTFNDKYKSQTAANITDRTEETSPGEVSNLTATAHNDSIQLTWSRPEIPNSNIISYNVKWTHNGTHCSVDLTTSQQQSQGNTQCGSTSPASITVNQVDLEYMVSGLSPYTVYNITVAAKSTPGLGAPKTISRQTNIAKPGNVINVNVTQLGQSEMTISWDIPAVNAGPVTYMAVAVDAKTGDAASNCTVAGYNSSSCQIQGLEEFWRYTVYVVGKTDAGRSQNVYSDQNFTTLPGKPGHVGDITTMLFDEVANRDNCDATKVNITWFEPARVERNSNITRYVASRSEGAVNFFTYVVMDINLYDPSRQRFILVTGLRPENTYSVTLHAVSADDTEGETKDFSFTTKACAPPAWDNGTYGYIEMKSSTQTAVTVTLMTKLFIEASQGEVKEKGLIVSRSSTFNINDHLRDNVLDLTNWQNASSGGYTTPYKIFVVDPEIIGKGTINKVIGAESCASQSTDLFCNGPLKDSLKIWVVAYACTSVSCTSSVAFGPFSTAAKPPVGTSSNSGLIIGMAILVVLLIAVAAFIALWFRGIIDPKTWLPGARDDSDDEEVSPIYQIPKKRPIVIENFSNRLEELHRDTNLLLSDQYADIKSLEEVIETNATTEAANLEPNKAKNRWVNILPYDHSRVKLQQIEEEDETSDYINANYMPGFSKNREYIATQGPLPGTIDDFWRMVWEQQVMVIVMLTQCKEGSRVKCEMYWPDVLHEAKQYGEVVVNPISISQIDKYNINIFEVSVEGQTRQVIHFHYLDFPDFSANVEFGHFVDFVRTVRSHVPHNMAGPMVIHCSAGVGRTGTFISVDRLNNYLKSSKFNVKDKVDIFDIVMSMRQNRKFMVQTESQYIMIHDCFDMMLEDKLKSMQTSESLEQLYANQGFDPYPEVQYENMAFVNQVKTEL